MFRRVFAVAVYAGLLAAAVSQASAQKEPSAQLKGYCPASYILTGQAVKGDPNQAVTVDGKLYYCADATAKSAFEKDPSKYLPQFNGVCTTALGGTYRNWMIADPTVFDIFEGKVYLFSSARAKAAYDRRPNKYRNTATEEFNKERVVEPVPRPAVTRPTTVPKKKPVYSLLNNKVPEATFTLVDGTPVKTREMKAKANVLMFYATWCSACKKTLPKLQEWADTLEGDGVKIMGVSMDRFNQPGQNGGKRSFTKAQVVDKWESLKLTLPLSLDLDSAGRRDFSVFSFPTFVMFDQEGMVQRVYVGGAAVANGQLAKDATALVQGGKLEPQNIEPVAKKVKRKATEMLNKLVPDGTFEALDGSSVSLKDPTKKATLAVFYTSWCKYCNKSMPQLSAMATNYRDKPVRFLAINQENIKDHPKTGNNRSTTRDTITQYWQAKGVNFDTAIDPEKVGRDQFLVSSYPTMMLIDEGGRIINVYIGARALNSGQIDREIRTLLGEE